MSIVACDRLMYWFNVADKVIVMCKLLYIRYVNFEKCIRMTITIFKIFIWGGILMVKSNFAPFKFLFRVFVSDI